MKNKEVNPQNYTGEIAQVAYAYWETRGQVDGHDVEDWLMAEKEVLRRHSQMISETEEQHTSAISHAA
jgi:hypothetical protein